MGDVTGFRNASPSVRLAARKAGLISDKEYAAPSMPPAIPNPVDEETDIS